ncbi:toll/interleukin-1 receptor domain-containing protein [Streptosporangium sp. NPDC006007]|uniref:toll/interleukin-1 receptor domain-containing protein n=1 Tax=Streptosporangium sp. NPDC006007 TaxID=3154575 RepID=UPI0033AA94C8
MLSGREGHRLNNVFISYAHEDGDWVRTLAERLRSSEVQVFFDEWDLLPGDLIVHRIDRAIRESTGGIQVFSPAAMTRPWIRQEYAALMQASIERGLRFIPILYGDADIPPFAATRVWMDFRRLTGRVYDDKVAELVRALRGGPSPPTAAGARPPVPEEFLDAARVRTSQPPAEPEPPGFVVCYARADVEYGERLVGHLSRAGLPAWSIGDLRWGDDYIWRIRQRLRYALAVVVLMSPEAQESDDLTREILEGHRHSREFFPILLRGERHYLLAGSWYFDARGGVLPGAAELDLLRRLRDVRGTGPGHDLPRVLPEPLIRPPVRAVRAPAGASLSRLRAFLDEREVEHADLLTTSLLLDAVNRQESGWMRRADGRRLRNALLTGVDAAWSEFSGGKYGFRAQLRRAGVGSGRYSDFLSLSTGYGWRTSRDGTVPRYDEFAGRGGSGAGFFPTLRNPQSEQHMDWYDQWAETVLTVHLRLRTWKGPR